METSSELSIGGERTAKPRFGLQAHQVFWAETGAVACACCHIPYPGSDSWIWDRWTEITPEVIAEIDRLGGRIACERCGREPRRLAR